MEYLKTSFLVVFPIFVKLALGYGLRQTRILGIQTFKEMNNVTFRVFLPVLLFSNIYNADISESIKTDLIVYAISALIAIFIFFMVVIPLLEKDNRKRGVLVQASCRSNFILFGIPVADSLYGKGSLGAASIVGGFLVPVINILAVISLVYFQGSKPNVKSMIKGIMTNPIIHAAFVAAIFVVTGIKIPPIFEKIIAEIAMIATPIALIVLGGSVSFSTVGPNLKQLILGVTNKLIIVPLIGVTVAILFGFRQSDLIILLALFASPTAVSSYAMANQMGGDSELAGHLVVFATALSMFTLFLWIFVLQLIGVA